MEKTATPYRPDIDGLRALAILAVVVFHAWPSLFPGGFIGVDVFFVISGYLITQIITAPSFSFSAFYQRRIRRIFPSLLIVLATTLCIGRALLAPNDFQNLIRYIIGGVFLIGNIVAYFNDSYFNGAATLKPLVHLWSLGVEEQFYLIWPIVVTVAARRGSLLRAITLIVTFSFSTFLWLSETDPRAAFYFAPPRFWELLVGAAVAVMPTWVRWRQHASLAGLLLIILSIFIIDSSVIFPGVLFAAPVIGAGLIVSAPERSLTYTALSSPLAVWFGRLSYPLYLWHWPLLALLRYYQRAPQEMTIASVLVLSVLLSEMTRRFVERPTYSLRVVQVVVGSMVGVVVIALAALIALQTTPVDDHRLTNQTCLDRYDYRVPSLWFCMQSTIAPPTVLLLGDSHANHLYDGIVHNLPNESILSIGACMPTVGLVYPEPAGSLGTCANEKFVAQSRFINERVLREPTLRRVFVAAMWRAFDHAGSEIDYWTGDKVKTFGPIETTALDSYAQAVEKQIAQIGSVPVTLVLYTPRRGISLSIQRQRQMPLRAEFYSIASRHPNVEIIDPMQVMCGMEFCRLDLLSDANHLSSAGSDFLAKALIK